MNVELTIPTWKFGFPETWTYLYLAIYGKFETKSQRMANFLNGLGLVIHHSAMALCVCFLLVGSIAPDRAVVSSTFILLVQHWFVLLKYVNSLAYSVMELVLEVWFEWMIFSQFEYFYPNHWSAAVAGASMIVAHWMYIVAAGIEHSLVPTDDEAKRAGISTTGYSTADSNSLAVDHHTSKKYITI